MDRTPLASEHCDPRWVQVHIYNLSEKLEAIYVKKRWDIRREPISSIRFVFLMDFGETSFFHFSMMKFMDFKPKLRTFVGANQAKIGVGGKSRKIQSPGVASCDLFMSQLEFTYCNL